MWESEEDWKEFGAGMEELDALLKRSKANREIATRETSRFMQAKAEMRQILDDLRRPGSTRSLQVCFVEDFPRCLRDAVKYYETLTSEMPKMLDILTRLNMVAMNAELKGLELSSGRADPPGRQ